MTEKRKYEKPVIRVFELSRRPKLLAGSNGQATTDNYTWQDENEE